jgi:hypothetical protein
MTKTEMTIDWTLERDLEKLNFFAVGQLLLRARFKVVLTETHVHWTDADGVEREVVQFVQCYNRYHRGQNEPNYGTVIRKVGEGLEGCWTRVIMPGGWQYRYPAGEDPDITGIQLQSDPMTGTVWGEVRPMFSPKEIEEIYAGITRPTADEPEAVVNDTYHVFVDGVCQGCLSTDCDGCGQM